LIAGTPFSGIGTVSQKFLPARIEIFSSKVRDCSIVSILEVMVEIGRGLMPGITKMLRYLASS
jgi:hypothetical protein